MRPLHSVFSQGWETLLSSAQWEVWMLLSLLRWFLHPSAPTGTWIANRKPKGKPRFQTEEMHGPWVPGALRTGTRCSQGGTMFAWESLSPRPLVFVRGLWNCQPLAWCQLNLRQYRVNGWVRHIWDEKIQLPGSSQLWPWLLKAKRSLLLILDPWTLTSHFYPLWGEQHDRLRPLCCSEIMLGLVTAVEPCTRQSVARSEWAVWSAAFGLLIRMSSR